MYTQSRKRLCETHVWKTQQGTGRSITNIYSLQSTLTPVPPCIFMNVYIQLGRGRGTKMIKFFLNVIRLLFIIDYFRQVNTFLRVDHPFTNRMFARQRYSKHMCIGTCVHRITEHVKIMMTKTAIIFKINSMFFFKKSKIL